MSWLEKTKKGAITTDMIFGELAEIEGANAQNRVVPSLLTRVGLNLGCLSDNLYKTLVAGVGKRPEALMNTVKSNFDARSEYNNQRMEKMKSNMGAAKSRPKLLQR